MNLVSVLPGWQALCPSVHLMSPMGVKSGHKRKCATDDENSRKSTMNVAFRIIFHLITIWICYYVPATMTNTQTCYSSWFHAALVCFLVLWWSPRSKATRGGRFLVWFSLHIPISVSHWGKPRQKHGGRNSNTVKGCHLLALSSWLA